MKNIFKHRSVYGFVCCGLVMLPAGCDWSDSDGFNTSSVNINVAGVYRAPNGGDPVVVDFRSRGNTSDGVEQVRGESLAAGNGSRTAFSGRFSRADIAVGSVQISGAGYIFVDNGAGVLVGNPAGSGAVTYTTGAWSINFNGVAPGVGEVISGSYSYIDESSNLESGASQTTIYQFNVQQTGNQIRIVDNNGDTYAGSLGGTQVTEEESTSDTLRNHIQFQASGNSRGVPISMNGIFVADVERTILVGDTNATELARAVFLSMDGTWIEPQGAGDIYGVAR